MRNLQALLFLSLALGTSGVFAQSCKGYSGPGGPCYTGPGGLNEAGPVCATALKRIGPLDMEARTRAVPAKSPKSPPAKEKGLRPFLT